MRRYVLLTIIILCAGGCATKQAARQQVLTPNIAKQYIGVIANFTDQDAVVEVGDQKATVPAKQDIRMVLPGGDFTMKFYRAGEYLNVSWDIHLDQSSPLAMIRTPSGTKECYWGWELR